MRDLIGRLEVGNDDAATALRVIDHFDHLVDERAPVGAFIRAAAALAACPAGAHLADRGLTRRFLPDGRTLPEDDDHTWPRVAVPGGTGSSVWLERAGPAGPLDALILERLSRSIQALTATLMHSSAAAAVRIACDPDATAADRRDATTRLGLAGAVTVVVRASGTPPSPRSAEIGRHLVTLLPGTPVLPHDVRAGAATAEHPDQLPAALARARVALRLADHPRGIGPSLVFHDQLGAIAAVAERFTRQEAAAVEDVQQLDRLLTNHPWVVETLQAVLHHTSLRQAAAQLHVHHSTLHDRLAWLPARLGYTPTDPAGRRRAAVALILWTIAHSDDDGH
ncbi:helix-turn-helix domain-containing protein [Dactylosporangium sp. NPDC005572]|uniref:helix-turn-helix domain-containing protein n=1 Tax=Dactylosporangium sp. NPDC005572 TaxID=3156889 RepID=UPI0033BBE4C2